FSLISNKKKLLKQKAVYGGKWRGTERKRETEMQVDEQQRKIRNQVTGYCSEYDERDSERKVDSQKDR
ncbi:hypothetical protein ACQP3J_29440, partial [Escherichia coli]